MTGITWKPEGFREILFSDGVRSLLQQEAEALKGRANSNNKRGGSGYETEIVSGSYGGGRLIAYVSTTDRKSRVAEAEDKALTGAV